MTCLLRNTLVETSGLPDTTIDQILRTAPRRYKIFDIPKRSGGTRTIAQPSKELKYLQRLAIDWLRPFLRSHDSAHGYVRQRGIRSNAKQHLPSNFLLKLDIVDFFPSILPRDAVKALINAGLEVGSSVSELTVRNLFYWIPKRTSKYHLCIGAPSSPALSNLVMFELDTTIQELCRSSQVVYTRYSDDMSFSCQDPNTLERIQAQVAQIFKQCDSPRLALNDRKTINTSRRHRRVVTGLTLTSDNKISLGRERMRLIRAMAHRFALGALSQEQTRHFQGLINFAKDVDPPFVDRINLMIRRKTSR